MDNITTPPPASEFTIFPLLPPELRLRIYSEILLGLDRNEHDDNALDKNPRNKILKISFSYAVQGFISNTPPPVTLSITSESRALTLSHYSYLQLGPFVPSAPQPLIPIHYPTTTLYLSLRGLPQAVFHAFLYHLNTSPSRHLIRSLAVDLRVWNGLCESGFVGVLAGMKGLQEVSMVVEFGRKFKGELGFLDVPEWRSDLCLLAKGAGRSVSEERGRGRSGGWGAIKARADPLEEVKVKCVLLTRGGEHA